MQGRDLDAVIALDAAAIAVNHHLLPLISARCVDHWFARRYWARSRRRGDTLTFVAEADGEVLGTASVDVRRLRNRHMKIRRWVYLHSLFVAPQARGRGIARRLIRHTLHWAQRHGFGGAQLEMAANNAPARALYAGLGFATQEVMMARRLPQFGP